MYEPFPGNYVWNLAVGIALATGGLIGETDRACRQLADRDFGSESDGTEAFFAAWCDLADGLVALAEDDLARGRRHSAGAKQLRASVYYQAAERLQNLHYAPRKTAYSNALANFAAYLENTEQPALRVEIPFEATSLPAIFTRADTPGPAPCVIFFNGLDSTKEQFYGSGIGHELHRRGISSLMVDTPGSGEALRLRGLTAQPESERWAAACIDWMYHRDDIDLDAVGLVAWSLGGYYGPRATAYEPRIKYSVAWGANYDWGQVQLQRLAQQGEKPVPHYWEHVRWVWGARDMDEFLAMLPRITLRGSMDRVRVPFLIVHGERDRQIAVDNAHQLYRDLVNAPRRDLKIFTEREGGVEHCSVDNIPLVRDYICDWIEETVASITSAARR